MLQKYVVFGGIGSGGETMACPLNSLITEPRTRNVNGREEPASIAIRRPSVI